MSHMAERGTKMAWEQQVQTATAASEWISVVRWATLLSFTYSYHLWETEICTVQCPILVGFFLSILFRCYLFWGDECFRKINAYIPATDLESKVKRTESYLVVWCSGPSSYRVGEESTGFWCPRPDWDSEDALSPEYKCQSPMGHVAAVPKKPSWWLSL